MNKNFLYCESLNEIMALPGALQAQPAFHFHLTEPQNAGRHSLYLILLVVSIFEKTLFPDPKRVKVDIETQKINLV